MSYTTINIGSVAVEIQFKPIKNLHLSVHPPYGKVTVSSPDFYDLEKVKIYLATKLAWIKREQKKLIEQERESLKSFVSHESHSVFGNRYLLKIISANKNKVLLKNKYLELHCKENATAETKKKLVDDWYRKELKIKIEDYMNLYIPIMNLELPEYRVYKMKTKWGSCSTTTKRLLFNIELAKKPIACIEYIVVHELVHLLERKHNKNFIILMDRFLPNWRVQKKILNDLPL